MINAERLAEIIGGAMLEALESEIKKIERAAWNDGYYAGAEDQDKVRAWADWESEE